MVQMVYLKKLETMITDKVYELNTIVGVREADMLTTKALEIMTVGSKNNYQDKYP